MQAPDGLLGVVDDSSAERGKRLQEKKDQLSEAQHTQNDLLLLVSLMLSP